jgi:hypothetical protein
VFLPIVTIFRSGKTGLKRGNRSGGFIMVRLLSSISEKNPFDKHSGLGNQENRVDIGSLGPTHRVCNPGFLGFDFDEWFSYNGIRK